MARSTVFRFKSDERDPQKVGRELGVGAVMTGKVLQQGDALVIQVDLASADDGSQLWGAQYSRKLADGHGPPGPLSMGLSWEAV
jgi:TolB-like protein